MSTPIANLIAGLGGGLLTQELGWRATFLFLGLPGLALALILHLTVQEPPRRAHVAGRLDQSLRGVFAILRQRPTILLITPGRLGRLLRRLCGAPVFHLLPHAQPTT